MINNIEWPFLANDLGLCFFLALGQQAAHSGKGWCVYLDQVVQVYM